MRDLAKVEKQFGIVRQGDGRDAVYELLKA